jgi:hypothetical protein
MPREEEGTPKSEWASDLPAGPPMHEELARLVESDGGSDEAENAYFESANDPQYVRLEAAQRRFRSQLRRRLRHRESKVRGHGDG